MAGRYSPTTSRSSTAASPCGANEARFLGDEEVPPRGWPEAIDPNSQDSITPAESRSRIGTEGNSELVTEDEIVQNEILSRSKAKEETAEYQ